MKVCIIYIGIVYLGRYNSSTLINLVSIHVMEQQIKCSTLQLLVKILLPH